MQNKIQNALNAVHAETTLKQRTKAVISEKINKKRVLPSFYRAPVLLACCLILILGLSFGSWKIYAMPVSTINVEGTTSVEMAVNRFDRIVSAVGCDEKGKNLVETTKLKNRSYIEAVETILSASEDDAGIEINVAGNNQNQTEEICKCINASNQCKAGNIICNNCKNTEKEEAEKLGLSLGKYRAYLELKSVDPDVSVEEISGCSAREIREMAGQNTKGNGQGHANGRNRGQNK